MGVASALGKFALKGAAKVGLGGAVGGPAGAAIGLGSLAFDVIPLINDLAKGDGDPAKVEAIKQARDGMAQKLVEAKGIPLDQAMLEVNDQLKPLIDEAAANQQGTTPGEVATDLAGLAGGVFLAHKAGFLGKGKAAAKPVRTRAVSRKAKPAAVADEPETAAVEEPETRQAMLVPPDGGTMPFDQDELKRMMIAAQMRGQPMRPPGMQMQPRLGLPAPA